MEGEDMNRHESDRRVAIARLGRVIGIALIPLTLPLGLFFGRDFLRNRSRAALPRVAGTVVDKRMSQVTRWMTRPEVTIQVDGKPDTVTALLSADADLPEHVTFRYWGTPGEEVFVDGETNPLWIMLFFFLASPVGIAYCYWLLARDRRQRSTSMTSNPQGTGRLTPPHLN